MNPIDPLEPLRLMLANNITVAAMYCAAALLCCVFVVTCWRRR